MPWYSKIREITYQICNNYRYSLINYLSSLSTRQVSPRPDALEAGLGDGACDCGAAGRVEGASVAEDQHQVPARGNGTSAGRGQRAPNRRVHLGRLHGPARVHHHATGQWSNIITSTWACTPPSPRYRSVVKYNNVYMGLHEAITTLQVSGQI